MNIFQDWCQTEVLLPAICTTQPEAAKPKFSQVTGLIMLPNGVKGPASWVNQSNMEDEIDNSVSDNSKAKYIAGRGGVAEPEEVIVTLGKRSRYKAAARYTLEFEIGVQNSGQYALAQKLQSNYRAFRFWFITQSGRLFGGQDGVRPDYISSVLPLGAAHDDVEKGIFRIDWYADGDPARTLYPDFMAPSGGGSPGGPTSNVMFYQQSFPAHTSTTLTWTANGGVLPTSNTKAQILVFQEGQKLEEGASIQYTISHLTAPGESEIEINAATHYSGANYEVIAFMTS